jgi:hypothetical protein
MEKLTELNDIVFSVLNNEFNNKKKWQVFGYDGKRA